MADKFLFLDFSKPWGERDYKVLQSRKKFKIHVQNLQDARIKIRHGANITPLWRNSKTDKSVQDSAQWLLDYRSIVLHEKWDDYSLFMIRVQFWVVFNLCRIPLVNVTPVVNVTPIQGKITAPDDKALIPETDCWMSVANKVDFSYICSHSTGRNRLKNLR